MKILLIFATSFSIISQRLCGWNSISQPIFLPSHVLNIFCFLLLGAVLVAFKMVYKCELYEEAKVTLI